MGGLYHYSFKMGRRPVNPRRDSFGAWLHYLRKKSGKSQEEAHALVCEILGHDVGRSTFSNWERKGNLGGRDTIPALATALGVTIEMLLRVKRTKDGKYIKLTPSEDKEAMLQEIGKRQPWDWNPPETMPKGYEAQKKYKKRHFDGVDGKALKPKRVKSKKAKKGDVLSVKEEKQGTEPLPHPTPPETPDSAQNS
jgi:transcriptional regulator with XRE-family HTH domain